MAEIRVENAVKTFGKVVAVDHVSLAVREHEFVVLLGPSGCGKTTLLRAIAGLGLVDSGRIMIGDRDVTYLPPKDRNISMVFQSYAIFPHMRVFDNIAFGLKMKRVPKDEIRRRVQSAAELLHIENFLERYPSQMSGGQRQRVAVARAIAVHAEVLLMDEPLSNLDALLRLEMRAELKRLLAELKATTVYVTHDQIEALSMGDRIAVMREGRILQFDSPTTVYDMPADRFVAGFIGTPPMNFLEGQVRQQDGAVRIYIGDYALKPIPEMAGMLARYDGQPIVAGIRAENMEALSQPAEDALKVTVLVVEPLGSQNLLTIRIGADIIKVATHPDFRAAPDQDIWIRFPSDKIRWIDRDSGKTLLPDLDELMA
ncbi:MAG: ABC transporter ATP-binding protein [Anaerolineae bacterium]|nr:ABC transporter ATP-binding protein [Anaerolineae bacterium]MEB2288896.1 ABC transporter ATP-binding protein [Anaerolineae bacterium]